ncbi:MAG: nitrile hydratase [Hyphomicrobiaceae bacterium]
MRGPHDVGGLPAGPVDSSTHNLTFWEKQIDAVRAVVGSKGIYRTDENRRFVESLGHEAYEKLAYYERWTAALMRGLIEKGVLTQDEIDAQVAVVRQRLEETGELEQSGGGKGAQS